MSKHAYTSIPSFSSPGEEGSNLTSETFRGSQTKSRFSYGILTSILFWTLGSAAWILAWWKYNGHFHSSVYSPADKVLQREIWHFPDSPDPRFFGRLNADQDDAWRNLCGESEGFVQLKLTEAEARLLPESVAIPKFPEYRMYGLAVCHQLHCLVADKNILRLALHPDYYKKTVPQRDHSASALRMHTGHCLDYLRREAMCKADTALEYFAWGDNNEGRVFPKGDIDHQCVNFDKIVQWGTANKLRDRGPWMGLKTPNDTIFD